ncbi:MAG: hypothetical protein NTU61_00995 [Candidatus Altiarchaeota archaeon]|nr:hypothetical protein [Candidatus Altiarchaeota archaeon]
MSGRDAVQAGIRLDYLLRIVHAILENKELESMLGRPLEKHVALIVRNNRFQFNQLTPFGEKPRQLTQGEEARVREIVEGIIKSNYPGTEDVPELR